MCAVDVAKRKRWQVKEVIDESETQEQLWYFWVLPMLKCHTDCRQHDIMWVCSPPTLKRIVFMRKHMHQRVSFVLNVTFLFRCSKVLLSVQEMLQFNIIIHRVQQKSPKEICQTAHGSMSPRHWIGFWFRQMLFLSVQMDSQRQKNL